jgi:hypothetical protein
MCNACYWQHTYRKRLAMDVEALCSRQVKSEFQRFGDWLPLRTDYKKAARSVNRYVLFFREVESHCPWPPVYADLLTHFGAERLRRMRLPVAWFIENRDVVVNSHARALDSERRRIAAILASRMSGKQCDALSGYYRQLMVRMGTERTSLRSVRLALSTAASLLTDVCGNKDELPEANDISRFLKQAPGRMASLTGFIHYLNLKCGTDLDVQSLRRKAKLFGKKNLEHELFTLLRRARAGEDITDRWILVGLKYFYGLSRRSMRGITAHSVDSGNGIQVFFEHESYWLPSPHEAT